MSVSKTNASLLVTACVVCASWSSSAYAALVTIEDPSGNSDFTLTYDDTQSGPFGTPFISNNTVFFSPIDFRAVSANGEALGHITDSFAMRLDAISPGVTLEQFNLTEQGDYVLDGAGAYVSATGELRAFSAFDPGNTFIDHLETGPLTTQSTQQDPIDWTGTASIDGSDGWTGSSSVWVTIENFLFADTDVSGEYAAIEKKFEGVSLEVVAVPLPAAVWMFGAALLTLVRRR